ncbi:MAG: hypothetical protein KAS32_20540 [Candidatus Peribacteraceae bacterium]|nr:hypothetical protein [Candidatus Peribacteraceae bacterium]
MAFFAQTGPTAGVRTAELLGKSLGQGISKNFPDPQQQVQRGLLQDALGQVPEGASLLDVMKIAGPQLMTTPGGSQLLSEIAPLLKAEAAQKAYLQAYPLDQERQAGGVDAQGQPTGQVSPTAGVQPTGEVSPEGEAYFRRPTPPESEQRTFPGQSVSPTPVPMMTPAEINQRTGEIVRENLAAGVPLNPMEARKMALQEQEMRIQTNRQVETERQTREAKQKDWASQARTRFENAGLGKEPDDYAIFERFASEAENAKNETDAYKYAKTKYSEYQNAVNSITRENVPNMAEKMWNKLNGTYKDKQSVIQGMQPGLKRMKALGLEDQARKLLTSDVGLGPEDTELALYPLSKGEKSDYAKIPPNQFQGKSPGLFEDLELKYASEESKLPPERFQSFKDELADIFKKNPESNLIGLRGKLNHEKKYAWQDVSNAISELIDEGRFTPDRIQEQQLTVIKAPPMPGLVGLFNEMWKDKR